MNDAVLRNDGTLMQFVGDAVMAVFGAPFAQQDHADHAYRAALAMHAAQQVVNRAWEERDLPPFELGIGLSTGVAAAALLGSEERLEYTIVGDTVNLAQRLQELARPRDRIVLSQTTWDQLTTRPSSAEPLEPTLVKGREAPVAAWMVDHRRAATSGG
jgi:class 3 adenylate cyclase